MRPRSETRVGRNSREPQSRPEVTDKRSPEVAAPNSKKIKLEQGIRPDVDMPDFGVHKLPSIDPGASACMTAQPSEETKPAENTASTEAAAATAPKSLLATRPPPPASFDLTADDDDDAAEDVEETKRHRGMATMMSSRPQHPTLSQPTMRHLLHLDCIRPGILLEESGSTLLAVKPHHGFKSFSLGLWGYIIKLTCPGMNLHSMGLRFRRKAFGYHIWKQ